MKNSSVIGIDLAKNILQVCKFDQHGEIVFNKAVKPATLKEIFAKSKHLVVAMEGCSGCHYWEQIAKRHGHEVRIIGTKTVKAFLQGHKTDANDALAIAMASLQAGVRFSPIKEAEQQSLQTLTTSQKFLTKQYTAVNNHIRSMLFEYGITVRKASRKDLREKLVMALGDSQTAVPGCLKSALQTLWDRYEATLKEIKAIKQAIVALTNQLEPCRRLLELEGVGNMVASMLYSELGDGKNFKNGRQAAAYIGVTPKQHSSGGKTYMCGINKYGGNRELRSILFIGALSYISKLPVQPRTTKEAWIRKLVERVGLRRACIALANKTVRTAWALLATEKPYQVTQLNA